MKKKTFDKHNKHRKREYQRQQVLNIEKANTEDPAAFWDFFQKLNPHKKQGILWEIYKNGEICVNKCKVWDHWTEEFAGLLTTPKGDRAAQERLRKITDDNRDREVLMDTDVEKEFNMPFTIEEIQKVLNKAKLGKAPGVN